MFVKGVMVVTLSTIGAIIGDRYLSEAMGQMASHILGVVIVAIATTQAYMNGTYTMHKQQEDAENV